jgi:hypothetical protein
MADSNPTDCGPLDAASPAAKDAQAEYVVLAFLLDDHPNQLTVPEVSWALNADTGGFDSRDAVERAVRELVGAGLLHCRDAFVLPTRAALYFERLQAER